MMNLDPSVLLELGKVKSQLSAGEFESFSIIIRTRRRTENHFTHTGAPYTKDISDMLSETKGLDADYVKSLSLLNDLLQDNFDIDTVTIEQENELVKSMKSIAWNQPQMKPQFLTWAFCLKYEFAEDPSVKEKIQWWKSTLW